MSNDANKIETVTITVDDKELQAVPGSMLIEVTDEAGIHIPRFCYHKKLSVSANCRMCLVEVEKAPKPLPACATPINEGMKVWTRSEKALSAQKDTMEFLLINHPLDCPICDQGGECELQDLSMAFGGSESNYHEVKRVIVDKDIGELVSTELTRCIQCMRCVRFGDEVAGMRELGAMGRGERVEIGTFVEQSLQSELSGNIIDICPVGALTAKPSRYTARAWEMISFPGIASHDSVGSHVNLHTFKKNLVRVVAGDNDDINECWISDRDRFSYEGVYSDDRAETPMIKKNGSWREVSWEEALKTAAEKLTSTHPNQVGVLASPRATLEELYLLQKSMRAIGVNNIDHRLRQVDFYQQESMGLYPWLGMNLVDIEEQGAVLLVGSDVRKEQPMINHRIRKAVINNEAKVFCVNPRTTEFNYDVVTQLVSDPLEMVDTLAGVAKASFSISKSTIPAGLNDLLEAATLNEESQGIATALNESDKSVVFLGSISTQHPGYSTLRALASVIAENTGSTLGYLTESSNSSGAWLAGAVPHRREAGGIIQEAGKDASQILDKVLNTYVLLDVEPEFDCDDPIQARTALGEASCVISISPYVSGSLLEHADIILPSAAYSETSGTFVNVEGRWQSFKAATKSFEDARPAWKILRVLGNVLGVEGFDYVSSRDVRDELKLACESASPVDNRFEVDGIYTSLDTVPSAGRAQRIGEVAEFSCDSLVRRAKSLQKSSPQHNAIQLNSEDVERLGLSEAIDSNHLVEVRQGDESVSMPLILNNAIPNGCVYLPAGTESSSLLGSAFGTVELTI